MIIFALIICLSSAGAVFADWLKYADNAEELQGALDDGAENIVITSSIKGNFSVPRWVKSITGSYRAAITIMPADESKPLTNASNFTRFLPLPQSQAFPLARAIYLPLRVTLSAVRR